MSTEVGIWKSEVGLYSNFGLSMQQSKKKKKKIGLTKCFKRYSKPGRCFSVASKHTDGPVR